MADRTKLLILSDAPTTSTGLGRITRELAQRIHANLSDIFEVATFGFGASHSYDLPWKQWRINRTENWAALELPEVWREFVGDEKTRRGSPTQQGVLMTIVNPGWVGWLSDPQTIGDARLREFLLPQSHEKPWARPFDLWGYFPVDGHGIGGRLPEGVTKAISGFDRILAYTAYGARVIDQSLLRVGRGRGRTGHLPHGLDPTVFFPRDKQEARQKFMQMVAGHGPEVGPLRDGLMLLGAIATNSGRKDWPLALKTLAELVHRGHDAALWMKTDAAEKTWNLPEMARELEVEDRIVATDGKLTDEQMSWGYAACDVTLGIGSGEGFGYPLVESLACGVPVVHGNYAGGAELIPQQFLVEPIAYKDDGFHCIKRPIFDAKDWADKVELVRAWPDDKSLLSKRYEWDNCWPEWDSWLRKGVGRLTI